MKQRQSIVNRKISLKQKSTQNSFYDSPRVSKIIIFQLNLLIEMKLCWLMVLFFVFIYYLFSCFFLILPEVEILFI